jgi:cell wall-associated NlpC family hydrolase
LPRTADAQFRAGPRVPDGQPLLPGDLVFYGNASVNIHHVGLYIGGGMMIDAPDFGQVVKIQPYRYKEDDYADAVRESIESALYLPQQHEHFRLYLSTA